MSSPDPLGETVADIRWLLGGFQIIEGHEAASADRRACAGLVARALEALLADVEREAEDIERQADEVFELEMRFLEGDDG